MADSLGAEFSAAGASGSVRLSATHKLVITLAIAGVIVLVYLLIQKNGGGEQPREAYDLNVWAGIPFEDDLAYGGQGDHLLTAYDHDGPTVYLPIRYPHRTGHNVSTVIHKGFSHMCKSAPQDEDWMRFPPSEVDI